MQGVCCVSGPAAPGWPRAWRRSAHPACPHLIQASCREHWEDEIRLEELMCLPERK